jgi:hypothetical protein
MINKKTWEEFRDSGLLWWINTMLHTFGWAIVFDFEDGEIKNVYPARVKFRGFGEKQVEEGYVKVSEYLKENVDDILREAKD